MTAKTFEVKPEVFINFHRAAEKPAKGFIPELSQCLFQPMGINEEYTDSALREVEREIDIERNGGRERESRFRSREMM